MRFRGIVRNRIASDGEGCVVHFSFKRDSVRLDIPESAREACQAIAGHNAFSTGFIIKCDGCASKYAEAAERRFQAAYRDKTFPRGGKPQAAISKPMRQIPLSDRLDAGFE